MRTKNVNTGYRRTVSLQRAYPANPIGTPTKISFDKVNPLIDGFEASIVSLFMVGPSIKMTIPAVSAMGDGVTMLQILQAIHIAAAPGSPQSIGSPAGVDVVPVMDGVRWGVLNSFWSGQSCFRQLHRNLNAPNALTGVVLTPDRDMQTKTFHDEMLDGGMPPQFLGPFFESSGAGGNFTFRPVFIHNFARYGEHEEDWAFPLRWLLGQPASGSASSGFLELTISPTVDSATIGANSIAYAAGLAAWDIWVDADVHGSSAQPCPATAFISTYDANDKVIQAQPGVTPFFGHMKPLDASGNMQAHGNTTVTLYDGAGNACEETLQANLYGVGALANSVNRKAWRPAATEFALAGPLAADLPVRMSTWGQPMTIADYSIMRMKGGPGSALRATVDATTETGQQHWVGLHLTATTTEMRDSAARWGGYNPGQVAVATNTRNSKPLGADPRANALPARIVALPSTPATPATPVPTK
jgi:hypothetical protein